MSLPEPDETGRIVLDHPDWSAKYSAYGFWHDTGWCPLEAMEGQTVTFADKGGITYQETTVSRVDGADIYLSGGRRSGVYANKTWPVGEGMRLPCWEIARGFIIVKPAVPRKSPGHVLYEIVHGGPLQAGKVPWSVQDEGEKARFEALAAEIGKAYMEAIKA